LLVHTVTVSANVGGDGVLGRLPTFLVIGAMKCGTTSLYRYLAAHPEIGMSPRKEIEFFSDDSNWARGGDWYREHFQDLAGALAVGECSTGYTKFPTHPDAPTRIAELLPNAKLVYLVRDPVERIRSHYEHNALAGWERLPIEVAVLENPEYLDITRYATQLRRYLEHFDASQILVMDSATLRHHRRAAIAHIYEFLDVDDSWWDATLEEEHYVTAQRPELRSVTRWVVASRQFTWARRLVPPQLRTKIARSSVATRERHQEQTPDEGSAASSLRHSIMDRLEDDITDLRALAAEVFGCDDLGSTWPLS
jgi:hypothetical protein